MVFRHLGLDIFLAATFFILFFSFSSFVHSSPFKAPWGQDGPRKSPQRQTDHRLNPLSLLVEGYRTFISPIDGRNCGMYPSCSKYSILCFRKHGLFIGWMMTCDRLFRCGRDELRLSPDIIVEGELRSYDPVENNDFWWYDGR